MGSRPVWLRPASAGPVVGWFKDYWDWNIAVPTRDRDRRVAIIIGASSTQGWLPVLLIGGQDGLPEDCPYALRYGGREWGDAIEAQGLLWPKANGFRALNGSSFAVGEEYPGNAGFCLDDQARVTSVYVAAPPTDPSTDQPAGSAAAP